MFRYWLAWRRPTLPRLLGRSTIGAEGFHGRVRDGIGCVAPRHGHQASEDRSFRDREPGIGAPGSLRVTRGRDASSWKRWLPASWKRWLPACLKASSAVERRGGVFRCARRACFGSEFSRAIRTGRLSASPRVHLRPIDVMVCHGSWARPGFEGGFPLRCLQRLSRPHIATRRCGWRHNRCTRGASIPVLSY